MLLSYLIGFLSSPCDAIMMLHFRVFLSLRNPSWANPHRTPSYKTSIAQLSAGTGAKTGNILFAPSLKKELEDWTVGSSRAG